MKVTAQHRYNCSIDELYALFIDKQFYLDKFTACGARNVKINKAAATDDGFVVASERDVPADVPGVLKSFLGDWNTIAQTESWEGDPGDEYYNDFEIAAQGVPVEMNGTMNLMPDGDGCVNDIEIEIKCSIPLVGKKLAQFVASDTEKTLAAEYEFTQTRTG
ncbi:MAG: DUF2505 domain-containing protein [Gammaproteobacteria bacterium]